MASPKGGAPRPEDGHAQNIDGPDAFAKAFAVSRETRARLEVYADLLKRWQKTINLVAPSTIPELWHRHMADSAQLLQWAPTGGSDQPMRWVDLGSGAGFPGLVIAIMAADAASGSPIAMTLIESDGRKAAFLREVARNTGVAVDIVCTRIESGETVARVGTASCVSARALAPLNRLFSWVQPFFRPDSVGLFLKGRDVESELAEAARSWDFKAELKPSQTDAQGRIVLLHALNAKTEG